MPLEKYIPRSSWSACSRTRPPDDQMATNPLVLTVLLTTLAVTGCRSLPPAAKNEDALAERGSVVIAHGVGQIQDPDTGDASYVLCAPCTKPTLKTRYRSLVPVALAREVPATMPPVPAPVVIQKEVAAAPSPEPAQRRESAAIKRQVPFAFSRSRLGPQGRAVMDTILEQAASGAHIHIRGYTDIIGTMPGNKRLALARAAEIRAFLVKRGISSDKLATSYCIDCFADTNETREGRAANRRAMVVVQSSRELIDLDSKQTFHPEPQGAQSMNHSR